MRRHGSIGMLFQSGKGRFLILGTLVTCLAPFVLYEKLGDNHIPSEINRSTSFLFPIPISQRKHQDDWKSIVEATERAILDFFHGEPRALQHGVQQAGSTSLQLLTRRLASRIVECRHLDPTTSSRSSSSFCTFRAVFVGSAQTSGRDIFYNQTYPFVMERRLKPLTEALGLELQVWNHAMDSDLSREGPQTTHMCIENLVGTDGDGVDVIGWDFDGGLQKGPAEQVEALVRWAAVLLQPALILFHRAGPHGKARRGKQRLVVNISPGHNAIVYQDQDDLPSPRDDEEYQTSSEWKNQWANQRNRFWFQLFQMYKSVVDLAAIDPTGAIYHLDHLLEFSNQAFDAQKALPLIDCGSPGHPPPCDQVPNFIYNHLRVANLSNTSLPRDDTGGAVCGVLFGCRHSWYGGTRSHEVRGELSAIPLLRALRDAAELAASEDYNSKKPKETRMRLSSLPSPKFCSKTFGNMVPTCITSYVPNLGRNITAALVSQATLPIAMPRLGASHYINNPSVQIRDLDRRFTPLGYLDRKLAYRLAMDGKKKKEDASSTAVAFTAMGTGPLVICEPPCFIDDCSKKRKMPLVDHVTLLLDGHDLLGPSPHHPWAIEVGGKFCFVIAKSIPEGAHILHISTNVTSPDHVLFSHVIAFVG